MADTEWGIVRVIQYLDSGWTLHRIESMWHLGNGEIDFAAGTLEDLAECAVSFAMDRIGGLRGTAEVPPRG